MSELKCANCNTQSPETALYCQGCGQPLRCQNCHSELLPTARVCTQCGKSISERSSDMLFHADIGFIQPGYNGLQLHETSDQRYVNLILSDVAIGQIGDIIPSLVDGIFIGRRVSTVNKAQKSQADVVDVATEDAFPQPQLPVVSSQISTPVDNTEQKIWEIFRRHGDELTQDVLKLKATNKKDYILRLVYLYLYAKLQEGEDRVNRLEVYKKLDDAGVKDSNISTYISHDSGIRVDDNESMLALNLEGRTKVQQYIVDVFDFEAVDGWYPGIETRATNNRVKQSSKKSNGQHNETDSAVSKWLSQETVKQLSSSIQHKTIDNMLAFDKALFGLYVVHKVEDEIEIQASSISSFLYKAFDVSVSDNTIRTALSRALEDKSRKSYVNFREGAGYRITPTGSDYVESLLK